MMGKSVGRIIEELGSRALAMRLAASGRSHQIAEIFALRRLLRGLRVDAVIDVGANAGQYATMIRKDVGFGGHIFSYEPNPEVFARLSRRARGDARWHVFNMALSDFDGTVPFHIMAADQFSSIEMPSDALDPVFVERNKVMRTVDMQCRRLDGMAEELFAPHGIARPFLKMDTQGHDKAVCSGAGEVLARFIGVQTELAVRTLYSGGTDYRAMITLLEAKGFIPNALFANNKGHFPLLVEMDGLFVRADLPEVSAGAVR